jgi:hypothetical protein
MNGSLFVDYHQGRERFSKRGLVYGVVQSSIFTSTAPLFDYFYSQLRVLWLTDEPRLFGHSISTNT